jgi:hypothetical protein
MPISDNKSSSVCVSHGSSIGLEGESESLICILVRYCDDSKTKEYRTLRENLD